MEQSAKQLTESLGHSGICQEFLTEFSEASRMPVSLHPPDSWQLPFHGHRHESPFCAVMSADRRACAMCLQFQRRLCHRARQRAATLACSHGFAVTAVPVRVNGELMGFLEMGQALRHPPSREQFKHCVRTASDWGVAVDHDALMLSFFRSTVVAPRDYAAWVRILALFAEHLSFVGSQIAIQRENAEPLVIRRAKEFIRERHAEGLRLAAVAHAVNSSPFHFCKTFKKHTGQNFTSYVARVRVEKAKNLLLNPDVQVSEIAYAVGFQSLTHFNRVFKNLSGETPTHYRQQVVAGAV